MKAGQINFLSSQAEYQHTVDINFKTPWWKKPGKVYEANVTKIVFFSLFIILFKEIAINLYHFIK